MGEVPRVTVKHLEERSGVAETRGAAHLTNGMHAELWTAYIDGSKAELRGQHWTNCASARQITAHYKVLLAHKQKQTRE